MASILCVHILFSDMQFIETKYRAMMGMGTLVSDSDRPHSDKTGMMCSGTSEQKPHVGGSTSSGLCGEYGGSSKVIKFLVSMVTVLSFSSLLQTFVQMFHHSDLYVRVNFESTS